MDRYKKISSIVLGVLSICAIGIWFILYTRMDQEVPIVSGEMIMPPFLEPKQIDENSKIYLNRLLRFSLIFPKDLEVKEYSLGNTSTIVFENKDTNEGFQVFVVPYSEDGISEERFKMDVPSGVMIDPVDVLIDGHTATMFLSNNAILGETREVWLIKNGFLYEITARKGLDLWLSRIISNLKFIE